MRILNLPGIGSSGPGHWQTLWEKQDPLIRRVEQRDWENPDCSEWLRVLAERVKESPEPPFLVAHSLGCLLVAHYAVANLAPVAGALLVAPADPDGLFFPATAQGFSPLPMQRLPFPSILVDSSDDPFAEPGFGKRCAAAWGSNWVNAGNLGHINAESGVGDWPQGHAWLEELIRRQGDKGG